MAAVVPIERSMKHIAESEPVSTIRNFPSTMSTRATGLHSRVSMVPRSFSPAVRSIAGYIAPLKHRMMMRYGTMPPKRLPPTFSGGATFSRRNSNGRASVRGRPRSPRRSPTVCSRRSVKNRSTARAAKSDFSSPE